MIGLFEVSATKAGKTISCTMFGNIAEKEQLFGELMNQHKIDQSERHLWKLTNITTKYNSFHRWRSLRSI